MVGCISESIGTHGTAVSTHIGLCGICMAAPIAYYSWNYDLITHWTNACAISVLLHYHVK